MPRSSCMVGFAAVCAAAVPTSAAITAIAKTGIRRVIYGHPPAGFGLWHPDRSKPYHSHLWVTPYALLSTIVPVSSSSLLFLDGQVTKASKRVCPGPMLTVALWNAMSLVRRLRCQAIG